MSAIAAPVLPEATAPPTEAEIITTLQRTVSPSRLTLFLQCRLKFWFRYVARIAKPQSAALHVGGSAHAVLKAWNKSRWRNEPLTLKQLYDEYVKAWADQAEEPVQWETATVTERVPSRQRTARPRVSSRRVPVR